MKQLRNSLLMDELGPHNTSQKEESRQERGWEMKDEEEREEKDKANFMTCLISYS